MIGLPVFLHIRAGGTAGQATFHYLSEVLAIGGGPTWLSASKFDTHLQEGTESWPGKLQAC